MPDTNLETLTIQIETTSKKASDNIEKLAKALKELQGSLGGDGFSKLQEVASGLKELSVFSEIKISKTVATGIRDIASAAKSITPEEIRNLKQFTSALSKLSGVDMQGVRGVLGATRARSVPTAPQASKAVDPKKVDNVPDTFSGATSAIKEQTSAFKNLSSSIAQARANFTSYIKQHVQMPGVIKNVVGRLGDLYSSMKRIAMYRLMRTAIKEITQAFREGINNLYEYSKATENLANGSFAKSMNDGATAMLYFKNALGTAVAPLLMSFIGWLDTLVDKIVVAINWVNQLYAKLTGRDYWYKAKKVATEYAGAAQAAGGAAKEALKYLLPFDELNVLPSERGGGGGGSATPDYSEMFEKMDEFDSSFDWVDKFREKLESLKEFLSNFKFSFKDVFFDWEDMTPEKVAGKIMDGLFGAAGAIIGWHFGGLAGAAIGLTLGLSLSAFLKKVVFNGNGKLDPTEIASLVMGAVFGIAGAIIGWHFGGLAGAAIGLTVGASLGIGLSQLSFTDEQHLSDVDIKRLIKAGIFGVMGAAVAVIAGGGVAGAAFGFTLGATLSIGFDLLKASNKTGLNEKGMLTKMLDALKFGVIFGSIGMAFGPAGAVLGFTLGATLSLVFESVNFSGLKEKLQQLQSDIQGNIQSIMDGIGNVSLTTSGTTITNTTSVPQQYQGYTKQPRTSTSWAMQELDKLKNKKYASGGFPEDGLFFANHSELVGRFTNGRTAVANNEQIVSGIAQGVEEANEPVVNAIMTAASQIIAHMGKNGVSMDDLARNVTKWQNRNARAMGY